MYLLVVFDPDKKREFLDNKAYGFRAEKQGERVGFMKFKLSREGKQRIVNNVKQYFLTEREEEIGDLAAEFLVDYMLEQLGPVIYNQAIEDAGTVINERMVSMEEEVHALKVMVKRDEIRQ